ncbi:unnamed protein product [Moneuplotes crassus]|uniref:Uncharacterized protein n=1 Tax=Euplotes crassus TaxID=5936 RepID=A0AAD1XPB5_EUPCR|nr:unnamed protein product [Moneuplotes crassus]
MNNIFGTNKPSPRLVSWTECLLANFCCCLDEERNLQTNEESNSCKMQKWLPRNSKNLEINPFIQAYFRTYCVCIKNVSSSRALVNSSNATEADHKDSKTLADSEPKQHDESVMEPQHEPENSGRIQRTTRQKLHNYESEPEDEFTLGRPAQSYKTRKDLVYKAAFRRMRKYFTQDFRAATKHHSPETNYMSRLREYCSYKFPESNSDRICVAFDCVINAKGRFGVIPNQDTELKSLIEKLMHFYSEKIFKKIGSQSGFWDILLYFLSIEGVSSLIFSDQRVSFQRKVKAHLHKLKERVSQMRSLPHE